MNGISDILARFKAGELDEAEALRRIGACALVNLGHTRVDLERKARTGAGEVIFGQGKTPAHIVEIARALHARGEGVLATRLAPEAARALLENFPEAEHHERARIVRVGRGGDKRAGSFVALVSAGTADMPVAEEARLTAEFFGSAVETFYDCGIAGLHRLAGVIERIRQARVIVAVAGMEGALPSVVAGLVAAPVIAVPTSVGYGANFGGLTALLAMMNSCANGVSVVNIDNGFGAGYNAHLINTR